MQNTFKQFSSFLVRHAGLILTIMAFCVLWFLAYQEFQEYKGCEFRIDRNDQIAIPHSDAANDVMNATALLSGDGFVNWRPVTHHQVYKPGWSLFLAFLMSFHNWDLVEVQHTMTILNALVIPLLYLLISQLFEERKPAPISFLAAFVYFIIPYKNWEIFKTLMTEGPTTVLLLSSLCFLAYICKKKDWNWWQGLIFGLLISALELVRSQAKYGFLLMMIPLVILILIRYRTRWTFFVFLVVGYLILILPVYGIISLNTGRLYSGTNYTSMVAVLHYSEMGKDAGGTKLSHDVRSSELLAFDAMKERVSKVTNEQIKHPIKVWNEGFPRILTYSLESPSKMLEGIGVKSHLNMAFLFIILIVSILLSFLNYRIKILLPLFFLIGYLAPNFAFYYFWGRFGIPIGWIGLIFIAGLLIQITPFTQKPMTRRLKFTRRFMRFLRFKLKSKGIREFLKINLSLTVLNSLRFQFLTCLGVILFLFGSLFFLNRLSLNFPESESISNHPKVLQLAQESSDFKSLLEITHLENLRKEIIPSDSQPIQSLQLGYLMFPLTMKPEDPIFKSYSDKLIPKEVTVTHFDLITPWKFGKWKKRDFYFIGELWQDYRVGEPILVYNPNSLLEDGEVQVIRLRSTE